MRPPFLQAKKVKIDSFNRKKQFWILAEFTCLYKYHVPESKSPGPGPGLGLLLAASCGLLASMISCVYGGDSLTVEKW